MNHTIKLQPFYKYAVTASFLEVYGEDIHDLLALNHNNPPSLPIREDSTGVTVVGLSSKVIRSADEALSVLQKGTMHRTTAATLMNKVRIGRKKTTRLMNKNTLQGET